MGCPNRLRQLARAIVGAQNLMPAPERMAELAGQVGRAEIAARPLLQRFPDGSMTQRYAVASPTLDWTLTWTGESFDFTRLPRDAEGTNLDPLNQFAEEAAHVFQLCVEAFQLVPHRFSLVEEGLVTPNPGDAFLTAAAQHVFRLPPIFEGTPPFEWDWRVCARRAYDFGLGEEPCNLIGTVKRLEGEMSGPAGRTPIRTLRIDAEINTAPENTNPRFTRERIAPFFTAAAGTVDGLINELLQHVHWVQQ